MSHELVKNIGAPLVLTMPDEERKEVMAAFDTNCRDGTITEFDLPRIKVTPGMAQWLISDVVEGDKTEPAIECVVLYDRKSRTYYQSKDAGKVPPDCSSRDGKTGQGTPGGECAKCPLAKWGSAGEAQACKESRQLLIAHGSSRLPEVLSIPPTSLKAVRQFFVRLVTQGIQYHHCILRFELEKAQNPQGKVYGKAAVKFVRKLSPEEIASAEEMRAFAQGFADRVTEDNE
ncbi:MAG TPA: hypothetical protein VFA33_05025 [Bryobacteraceae bacterium]|nr:hypothetical protein [Bryobacteraceae bacterium]